MLIDYNHIENLTVSGAIQIINAIAPKTLNTITVSDLTTGVDFNSHRIFSIDKRATFGCGIYVITFPSENWCYIGQTPKNFFDRMHSQTSTRYRKDWGWNSLNLFVANKLNKNKETELSEVREWVLENGEARFIYVPEGFKRFLKFENLITSGISLNTNYEILNSTIHPLKSPGFTIKQHLK